MINNRLKMILSREEISRIKISESDIEHIKIIVDVHGLKCFQVRRFINNIINAVRTAFQLIVIHGYNHGTAIKDMLAENYSNYHICTQYVDSRNPGITHMQIAA